MAAERAAWRGRRADDSAACDVRDLAGEYGTPLYVYDEDDFRSRCREFKSAFSDRWGRRLLRRQGLPAVRRSPGGWPGGARPRRVPRRRARRRRRGGFPPERVAASAAAASRPPSWPRRSSSASADVVDSFHEIAGCRDPREGSGHGVRDGPGHRGVEAHTHEYIATAHEDQRIGCSISSGDALDAVQLIHADEVSSSSACTSHIGSQIFDSSGFEVACPARARCPPRSPTCRASSSPSSTSSAAPASPTPPRTTRRSRRLASR